MVFSNADGLDAGKYVRHLNALVANVNVVLQVQEIPLGYTEVFAKAQGGISGDLSPAMEDTVTRLREATKTLKDKRLRQG